jgi:hypothetical protein
MACGLIATDGTGVRIDRATAATYRRQNQTEGHSMTSSEELFAKLHERGMRYKFIYSICGLVLGFVCIIGGIALFLNGVAGATSWTAKFLGASSSINDAAPGSVLFIVGLFIVFVTRFKVSGSVDTRPRPAEQPPAASKPKKRRPAGAADESTSAEAPVARVADEERRTSPERESGGVHVTPGHYSPSGAVHGINYTSLTKI